MKFSRNTLLAAVVTLTSIAAASQVQACKGGGGGGYSRGFSGGYSSSSYGGYNSHRSSSYGGYAAPVQSYAPSYSTPNYYSQPQPVGFRVSPFNSSLFSRLRGQSPLDLFNKFLSSEPLLRSSRSHRNSRLLRHHSRSQLLNNSHRLRHRRTLRMSALQALGGFAPPAATPAPAPQQQQVQRPAHVGNWTATLGNGATVRLSLQADGNFSWVATNKTGSRSSFSGSYTVSNGSLTLNRSNDSQQLGGTMTISNNNAFSFKVAGNNAAGIDFSRS